MRFLILFIALLALADGRRSHSRRQTNRGPRPVNPQADGNSDLVAYKVESNVYETCECDFGTPSRGRREAGSNCPRDVIIAIDTSACVKPRMKRIKIQMNQLFKQIVKDQEFGYETNQLRLGIVSFSENAQSVYSFSQYSGRLGPDDHDAQEGEIEAAIDDLTFLGETTNYDKAFRHTVTFFSEGISRPNAARTLIIFTNGAESKAVTDVARLNKLFAAHNIGVFPVSFSPKCDGSEDDDVICAKSVTLDGLATLGTAYYDRDQTTWDSLNHDINNNAKCELASKQDEVAHCTCTTHQGESHSGTAGDRGPTGAKGEPGDDGMPGSDGRKGAPGRNGNPGGEGLHGIVGDRGDQGSKGGVGRQGSKGPAGSCGERGERGDLGHEGNKGQSGSSGASGEKGVKGDQGQTGNKGKDGGPGDKGSPGRGGPLGPKGNQGLDGPPGPPGQTGQDATCEAGDVGGQGSPGIPGEPGRNGQKGEEGLNGKPGSNGGPGTVGPTGRPGERGPKGPKGERGQDGSNGNPGHPGARGPPGNSGPPGQNGDPGQQGQRGPQGDAGYNGINGAKGQKGEQGKNGDDGPKGKCGHEGFPGLRGMVGYKGPNGEKGLDGNPGTGGPQGCPGDLGETGPTGPPGVINEQSVENMVARAIKEIYMECYGAGDDRVTTIAPETLSDYYTHDRTDNGGDIIENT